MRERRTEKDPCVCCVCLGGRGTVLGSSSLGPLEPHALLRELQSNACRTLYRPPWWLVTDGHPALPSLCPPPPDSTMSW